MLPFNLLPSYWTHIAAAAAAATVVGLSAWAMHSWSVDRLKARQATALAEQAQILNDQCSLDKLITTETSHELQTQLTDARNQLAAAKRVQQNRCVSTPARPAARHDAAPANPQLHNPDGIYADSLLDFAYDAEVVGRQLDSCQSFITKTWKAKGQ